jgi:hypothetical protein
MQSLNQSQESVGAAHGARRVEVYTLRHLHKMHNQRADNAGMV